MDTIKLSTPISLVVASLLSELGIAPDLGKSHPYDSHVEEMHKDTLCIIDRGY